MLASFENTSIFYLASYEENIGDDHDRLLSQHYIIYCPDCGESLAGAACNACGRVYTWKLGTVASHEKKKKLGKKRQGKASETRPHPKTGPAGS